MREFRCLPHTDLRGAPDARRRGPRRTPAQSQHRRFRLEPTGTRASYYGPWRDASANWGARVTDEEVTEIGSLLADIIDNHAKGERAAYLRLNQMIHRRTVEIAAKHGADLRLAVSGATGRAGARHP
jgi:hypothetical protein